MYSSDIRTYNWKIGQEFTEKEYNEVLRTVVFTNARKKALSLLAKMDYASGDMRLKLRKAEFPEEVIELVISGLLDKGYLDDRRYAQNYVETRSQSKGKGMLRLELQKKGICAEEIELALETLSGQEEQNGAYMLLKKKYLEWRREQSRLDARKEEDNPDYGNSDLPDYPSIQKMKAALFRKGYSGDVINRAWFQLQEEMRERNCSGFDRNLT